MEDGLEAQSESANFERIVFLYAVIDRFNSHPVFIAKRFVIVGV